MQTLRLAGGTHSVIPVTLLLVVFTLIPCISGSYFTLSDPNEKNATAAESKNTTIVFVPKPWPPAVLGSQLGKNSNLTLDFFHIVDNSTKTFLCRAVYVDSAFVTPSELDDMVPCSNSSDGRVRDYRPERDNVTFVLPSPKYSDRGFYELDIKVNGQKDTSAAIWLSVYVWPQYPIIDSFPDGIQEGSEVNITCHVTGGHPAADLKLSLDNKELIPVSYSKSENMTISTITLTATKELHGKLIQCEAWNAANVNASVKNFDVISVLSAPDVVLSQCGNSKGGGCSVLRHGSLCLECIVKSLPSVDSIDWFRKEDLSSTNFVRLNNSGPTYNVRNVTDEFHNNVFACSATNKIGTSNKSDSCQIDVQYGAIITLPKEKRVKVNDSFTLSCLAKGNPNTILYKWFWNSAPKSYDQNLTFTSIKMEEEGNYTCHATNVLTIGSETTQQHTSLATIQLIVEGQPVWDNSVLQKVALHEGKDLSITCAVLSHSKTDFYWKFSGLVLNQSKRFEIKLEEHRSILVLTEASNSDLGDYICVASGSAGQSEFVISALKPGKPDSLHSCYVHNETTSSATAVCGYGYDGGDRVSVDAVILQTGGHEVIVPNTVSEWTENKEPYIVVSLTGLAAGANYNLNIYAKNKYGRSDAGVILEVNAKIDHSIDEMVRRRDENPAAIIGGVVGGVVCIAVLSSIAVCAYVKYQRDQSADDMSPIVPQEVDVAFEDDLQPANNRSRLSIQYSDDIINERTRDYNIDEINQQSDILEEISRSFVNSSSAKCHRASCPQHPSNIKKSQGPDDDIVEECQCDDIWVEYPATRRQDNGRKYEPTGSGNILSQTVGKRDCSGLGARPKELRNNIFAADTNADKLVSNGHSRNAITIENRGGDKTVGVVELHIPPPPPPPGKLCKPLTESVTPLISFDMEESILMDTIPSKPLRNGFNETG